MGTVYSFQRRRTSLNNLSASLAKTFKLSPAFRIFVIIRPQTLSSPVRNFQQKKVHAFMWPDSLNSIGKETFRSLL